MEKEIIALCLCGNPLNTIGTLRDPTQNKPKDPPKEGGRYCLLCGAYLGPLVFVKS